MGSNSTSSLHDVLLRREQCVSSKSSRINRMKISSAAATDTRSELRRQGDRYVSELRSAVLPCTGSDANKDTDLHTLPLEKPRPPSYHERKQPHQQRYESQSDELLLQNSPTFARLPLDNYWAPFPCADPSPVANNSHPFLANTITEEPRTPPCPAPALNHSHSRQAARPLELSPRLRSQFSGGKDDCREYFLAKLKRLIDKTDSHALLRRSESSGQALSKCGGRRQLDPLTRSDSKLLVAQISAANWFGTDSKVAAAVDGNNGRYFRSMPEISLEVGQGGCEQDSDTGARTSEADAEVETLSRKADSLLSGPLKGAATEVSSSHQKKRNGRRAAEPSYQALPPSVFSLEALKHCNVVERGELSSSYDELEAGMFSEPHRRQQRVGPYNNKSHSKSADGNKQTASKKVQPSARPHPPARLQSGVPPRLHRRTFQRVASTRGNKGTDNIKPGALEAFVMDAWQPSTPHATPDTLCKDISKPETSGWQATGKRCRLETEIWNFDPEPHTPPVAGSSWREPTDHNGRPLQPSGFDVVRERDGYCSSTSSGYSSSGEDSDSEQDSALGECAGCNRFYDDV